MRPVCTYTDFFVICTGQNPRQTDAIFDEVHAQLKREGRILPKTVDGAKRGHLDRRRLPRRGAPRLHAGRARLLPARGPVGRRPGREGRSRSRPEPVRHGGYPSGVVRADDRPEGRDRRDRDRAPGDQAGCGRLQTRRPRVDGSISSSRWTTGSSAYSASGPRAAGTWSSFGATRLVVRVTGCVSAPTVRRRGRRLRRVLSRGRPVLFPADRARVGAEKHPVEARAVEEQPALQDPLGIRLRIRRYTSDVRGHSSAGRASGWQPEGRRFEPGWLH